MYIYKYVYIYIYVHSSYLSIPESHCGSNFHPRVRFDRLADTRFFCSEKERHEGWKLTGMMVKWVK
jgi:hypothetical protein